MCYNEPVSWITLALGTLFSLINFVKFSNNTDFILITFFWLGAITMQFWEANIHKYKNNPRLCNIYTKGAFFNNILQPLFLLPAVFVDFYKTKKISSESIAIILMLVFYFYGLYTQDTLESAKEDYCAYRPDGIVYNWWRNMSGLLYFSTIFILLLLIFKGNYKFQIVLFFGSYLISHLIRFGDSGSIWCWIASLIPIVNYFYFGIITKS